jgi:hypothetical protein
MNWLRVFHSAEASRLGHGVSQLLHARVVRSEKCVGLRDGCGTGMCVIAAFFARVLRRCTGRACIDFLLILQEIKTGLQNSQPVHGEVLWRSELLQILQEVRTNGKTRNQLQWPPHWRLHDAEWPGGRKRLWRRGSGLRRIGAHFAPARWDGAAAARRPPQFLPNATFLDDKLLPSTSHAVERGNRRYRKMQKHVYRVRTQAQIRARFALDLWREAQSEGRHHTLHTLHAARAG